MSAMPDWASFFEYSLPMPFSWEKSLEALEFVHSLCSKDRNNLKTFIAHVKSFV